MTQFENVSELYRAVSCVSMMDTCTDRHYVRVLELLRVGGDPNEVDDQGQSLLVSCANMRCGWFDLAVAMLLIEWGADPTATFEDKTAPEWVVHRAGFGSEELQHFIDHHTTTTRSIRAIQRSRIVGDS